MNAKQFSLSVMLFLPAGLGVGQNAWINEIHYDNSGTDVNEFIEVVVGDPGSYNLADFMVMLYNGGNGSVYETRSLSDFTAGTDTNNFTFYWFNYTTGSTGIQNGSPDGMAISYQGMLISSQWLSYEGAFVAADGPAAGLTSVDIGTSESGTTPAGYSLQLGGMGDAYADFTWQEGSPSTPGQPNINQVMGGGIPPQPGFWADRTEIHPGETVNFFDSSLYSPQSWIWSFLGGEPYASNDTNPDSIHYNYPGIYNVCLTTINEFGMVMDCREGYITVDPPPAPVDCHLVITEIMYNPPESGTDTTEFIELYNNDTSSLNLEGFYFSDGISFSFPAYNLPAHEYLVVSYSDTAVLNTYGKASLQWTSGSLSNAGELILLKDCNGFTVDSVRYDDGLPWDPGADGGGGSLELCDPYADNSEGANWQAAVEYAAINADGDTLWASPGAACMDPPVGEFNQGTGRAASSGILVYPNPSGGIFKIIPPGTGACRIEILSSTGIPVLKRSFPEGPFEADLSEHPEGLYFMRLYYPGNNTCRIAKIMISR